MNILRISNRILKKNGTLLIGAGGEPPAPALPPYTLRLKFTEGVTPSFRYGTGVQVSSSPNIWDLTYENTRWGSLLASQRNLLEVIAANIANVWQLTGTFQFCTSLTTVRLFDTSGVLSMTNMFYNCNALTSVPLFDTSNVTGMNRMFYFCTHLTSTPLFDTSNVTNMNQMFYGCSSLITVPLLNTSKCTNIEEMFRECRNVQSGALALYQQASSQATPPASHGSTFYNCGSNTTTGAAELAQIPTSWGGTMS